jgi:hypothetical protein
MSYQELEKHMIELLGLPKGTRKMVLTMEVGKTPMVEVEYFPYVEKTESMMRVPPRPMPVIKEKYRLVGTGMGDVSFTEKNLSTENTEFIATRRFMMDEIVREFNVPVSLLYKNKKSKPIRRALGE